MYLTFCYKLRMNMNQDIKNLRVRLLVSLKLRFGFMIWVIYASSRLTRGGFGAGAP